MNSFLGDNFSKVLAIRFFFCMFLRKKKESLCHRITQIKVVHFFQQKKLVF